MEEGTVRSSSFHSRVWIPSCYDSSRTRSWRKTDVQRSFTVYGLSGSGEVTGGFRPMGNKTKSARDPLPYHPPTIDDQRRGTCSLSSLVWSWPLQRGNISSAHLITIYYRHFPINVSSNINKVTQPADRSWLRFTAVEVTAERESLYRQQQQRALCSCLAHTCGGAINMVQVVGSAASEVYLPFCTFAEGPLHRWWRRMPQL